MVWQNYYSLGKKMNVWVCLCNNVISRLTYLINLIVAEFIPRIYEASRDGYINAVFLPVSVTRVFVCVCEYFS